MGLDMYLVGQKFLVTNYAEPEKNLQEDGFRLQNKELEIGYWRKHPDLHGFIVDEFAGGVDECQRIELGIAELKRILEAVEDDELPHTEGFFFGASAPEDKVETIVILEKAIEWLEQKEEGIWRSVYYQASW